MSERRRGKPEVKERIDDLYTDNSKTNILLYLRFRSTLCSSLCRSYVSQVFKGLLLGILTLGLVLTVIIVLWQTSSKTTATVMLMTSSKYFMSTSKFIISAICVKSYSE